MKSRPMGLAIKLFILLVLIIILFAATNPSTEEYANLVVNHELGNYSNPFTKAIGVPVVQSLTTTHNYFVFSTFTTDIPISGQFKVIGFLKKIFIPIS